MGHKKRLRIILTLFLQKTEERGQANKQKKIYHTLDCCERQALKKMS